MRVAELIALLERFEPDAVVRLSAGGKMQPRPHVAEGVENGRDAVVVVADRERFPGAYPSTFGAGAGTGSGNGGKPAA